MEKPLLPILICAGLLVACNDRPGPLDPASYESQIEAWRAERVQRLKGPDGYLNLAGLYWLSPGQVSIGSAKDNDIVFPDAAAEKIGQLEISDDGVTITVHRGVTVLSGDQVVESLLIADDTTDEPVTLRHASLVWTIIKRDQRYALRLRDYEHPAIEAFPPLEYFPIDPELRVSADLRRFDEPKILDVDTVIEGLGWHPQSPGKVLFTLGGQEFELEAYASGDELFFVFGDLTSGRETYPAGRFLYADWPDPGEQTVLDFNRAYNPPCAFNDFATCPVASPQNRLNIRIAAGEKFDPEVHSTPGSKH